MLKITDNTKKCPGCNEFHPWLDFFTSGDNIEREKCSRCRHIEIIKRRKEKRKVKKILKEEYSPHKYFGPGKFLLDY